MRVLIAAISLAFAASPAFAGDCFNMKYVKSMHFVSDQAMTVQTVNHHTYTMTFKDACAAHKYPLTHFVYEPWTHQCVSSGDALPTNDMGPCFVQSVHQTS